MSREASPDLSTRALPSLPRPLKAPPPESDVLGLGSPHRNLGRPRQPVSLEALLVSDQIPRDDLFIDQEGALSLPRVSPLMDHWRFSLLSAWP